MLFAFPCHLPGHPAKEEVPGDALKRGLKLPGGEWFGHKIVRPNRRGLKISESTLYPGSDARFIIDNKKPEKTYTVSRLTCTKGVICCNNLKYNLLSCT